MTQQMTVVRFEEFGGVEVLHPTRVDLPEPGDRQVRIRVALAGVNPVDALIRSGSLPELPPLPHVPGSDVVGTVDAVGPGAAFAVGDEVFGYSDSGAYAQYALATAVVHRPAGLSAEAAVALPVPGEAALRALTLLDLEPGETLMVHGAAGAVGSIAAQVALARGVAVLGTAHPDRLSEVAALGAVPVAYGAGLVERVRAAAPRVDAVLDAAGHGALPAAVTLRGGTDRIVTVADPAGASGTGVTFSAGRFEDRSVDTLAELAAHVVDGGLRTPDVRAFRLAEAGRAHELVASGRARAKVVLTP